MAAVIAAQFFFKRECEVVKWRFGERQGGGRSYANAIPSASLSSLESSSFRSSPLDVAPCRCCCIRLMELTLGTVARSQTPSFSNRSRISQLKMPGFLALYSSTCIIWRHRIKAREHRVHVKRYIVRRWTDVYVTILTNNCNVRYSYA